MFLNILCDGGCLEQFMFSCYRDASRFSFLIMTALLGEGSLFCTQYSNHEHHTLYLLCVILKGFMYFRIMWEKMLFEWKKVGLWQVDIVKKKILLEVISTLLFIYKKGTKAETEKYFCVFSLRILMWKRNDWRKKLF